MTHILLVEDNPIDARLVRRAFAEFKDWSAQITWVDDGQKALWYLQSLEAGSVPEPPAFVLLDVNLPKYDGIHVLGAFRRSAKAWNIPVFLCSSAPAEDVMALAAESQVQADGYFEKQSGLQGFVEIAAKVRAHVESLAFAGALTASLAQQALRSGDHLGSQNG